MERPSGASGKGTTQQGEQNDSLAAWELRALLTMRTADGSEGLQQNRGLSYARFQKVHYVFFNCKCVKQAQGKEAA